MGRRGQTNMPIARLLASAKSTASRHEQRPGQPSCSTVCEPCCCRRSSRSASGSSPAGPRYRVRLRDHSPRSVAPPGGAVTAIAGARRRRVIRRGPKPPLTAIKLIRAPRLPERPGVGKGRRGASRHWKARSAERFSGCSPACATARVVEARQANVALHVVLGVKWRGGEARRRRQLRFGGARTQRRAAPAPQSTIVISIEKSPRMASTWSRPAAGIDRPSGISAVVDRVQQRGGPGCLG